MSSAVDPTAAFYHNLQDCGLLSAAQLRELWGWIAHKKPDAQALAREINRRGWLTVFQIKEIARGRGASLSIAGRYTLLDILGEGGMGRVYKAHDKRMDRAVAFKVIRKEKLSHPAASSRFETEIQALSAMDHPNVVKVYDAERVGDHHFYVMEFIDGTDLTKIVRDRGPLPVPEACEIIRQTALGLQHAFEKGLVHRDIKPSNIIVSRNNGPVKLVDLGLARLMEQPGGNEGHRVTQEGFVIGTPDFLAPEQARDPMGVDIRADIYALGGTLYYILTGRVPYDGINPTEKLIKHCTDPPPSLLMYRPDAPPPVEHIIHWCMAKRPEDRPQTPIQLARALHPYCLPPGAFVAPGPAGLPPTYPQPTHLQPPAFAVSGMPLPPPDPNPSSQVFKLPPQTTTDDPIRRRSERKFPTGFVLLGLGALLVLAIFSYAIYRLFRSDSEIPDPFTNTQGMKMVRVEGGMYRRGSPETETARRSGEGPVHEVIMRGPFFISATEVTNGQFIKVMLVNPSRSAKFAARAEYLPVDSVTWEEANEFCRKLTALEENQPWARKGWEYRLPTEAEWEFAARAGTMTPFAFGEQLTFGNQGVYKVTGDDPLERGGDASKITSFPQDVGKTEANKFGLHDMHGNVAEWCSDWYKPEAYKDAPKDNPTGPADGDKRVIRGGSYRDPASGVRSAVRAGVRPTERLDTVGFRIVYAPVRQ
ncbi:MAG: bifunctional serine/threonine-protein kinase/formylglycine-generating enzyme family protein [Planctomycetia bacterium]|nr:bifunctional serine/threonine-protein kinase/formylglycine-generating enzyme family protein [Planctomycetia bacterium]